MSKAAREVLVIGSGVSGLTCGIRLLEAGFRVRIVAREPAQETVSRVAGAVWLPYRAEPAERVLHWAAASLEVFRELARDPASGVRIVRGVQVGHSGTTQDWSSIPGTGRRAARADELPRGHREGLVFALPVIDTSVYLERLVARFEAAGGRIELGVLTSLDEALERCPRVVNASGLGARELALDRELFPIRGQIACVARGAVDRILLDERDEERIAYVVPRTRDVVLGSVAEVGREELEPDAQTTRAILERCTALEPRLANAELLEVRVGLRPGRSSVRLEAERRPKGLVVHDYGHGGAGVTLSWGCAAEVVELLRA